MHKEESEARQEPMQSIKDAQELAKSLTQTEIKKRLKSRSKADLIKVVNQLAMLIDGHKERNEETRDMINEINAQGGFNDYSYYSKLIEKVDKDV